MGLYSRYIAPWLVDCACGTKPIAYQRRKIIPRATGIVLEIGAGGGRNFALYDREKVERVIALEPDGFSAAQKMPDWRPALSTQS
jgi:predicted RNA methylase